MRIAVSEVVVRFQSSHNLATSRGLGAGVHEKGVEAGDFERDLERDFERDEERDVERSDERDF
jgi:hypothetical protein